MDPDKRRAAILEAAFTSACTHGLENLTREHVAHAAGVSEGLVSVRLGTMPDVKRAVRALATRRHVDLNNGHREATETGEWEWLHGRLSPTIRFRLLVNSELGVEEIKRLIDQLEAQRAALAAPRK